MGWRALWYTDSRNKDTSELGPKHFVHATERPRVLKDTSMSTVSVKAVAAATGIVACAAYYARGGNPVRLVRAQSTVSSRRREETMMGDGLFFYTSRGLHYVSPPPAPAAPAARISSTPTEHVLEQLPCGTMVMVSRNQ